MNREILRPGVSFIFAAALASQIALALVDVRFDERVSHAAPFLGALIQSILICGGRTSIPWEEFNVLLMINWRSAAVGTVMVAVTAFAINDCIRKPIRYLHSKNALKRAHLNARA
ncbi:MAG: hypothetical protein AAF065_07100 [Verrucomicrobiota bacterium]